MTKGHVMSDENNKEPIGEPQPVNPYGKEAMFERVGAVIAIAGGGLALCAALNQPVHVRGATQSARLKWQERQVEIQKAISSAPTGEAGAIASPTQSQPANRAGH